MNVVIVTNKKEIFCASAEPSYFGDPGIIIATVQRAPCCIISCESIQG